MNKILKSITTIIILLISYTHLEAAQGVVNENNVRFREGSYLGDNIKFNVSRGREVDIVSISGDFYRVRAGYYEGYIFRDFINITSVQAQIRNNTNYYMIPVFIKPNYETPFGFRDVTEAVTVTGVHENWFRIEHLGEEGFVEARFLEVPFGNSLRVVRISNSLASEIIEYAKTFIGTRYVFGSMDPARGFDCSGFVNFVMSNFGINLQRSSRDMAQINGTRVTGELQKGDFVFFATGAPGRVSHVGIYIGEGRFIHSATIGGVKISRMSENYYRTRFLFANRVLD